MLLEKGQKAISYHPHLSPFQRILSLLPQLRFRETGLECIETMLRCIYYSRGKAEWHDLIEIMHRSDPIIEAGSRDDGEHTLFVPIPEPVIGWA